jgi:hypothetical protein
MRPGSPTSRTQAQEDLAFLRTIAEQAQATPPTGGPLLLWWGCLLACSYLAHGAILMGWLPIKPWHLGFLWLAAMIVGWLGHTLIWRHLQPGTETTAALVLHQAWLFGGIVITLIGVSANLRAMTGAMDPIVFPMFGVMCLALYSIVFMLFGAAGRFAHYRSFGVAGAGVAIALVWLIGSPLFYLAVPFGFVIAVILPALHMIRSAR